MEGNKTSSKRLSPTDFSVKQYMTLGYFGSRVMINAERGMNVSYGKEEKQIEREFLLLVFFFWQQFIFDCETVTHFFIQTNVFLFALTQEKRELHQFFSFPPFVLQTYSFTHTQPQSWTKTFFTIFALKNQTEKYRVSDCE